MAQTLTIQHLETLWKANNISPKTKAVVFELSQYSNEKELELILCTANVRNFARTLKFRDSGIGSFEFEYEAIQFLQDEKKNNIVFPKAIIEGGLDATLNVFQEFSRKVGFDHCESLGIYAKVKNPIVFHVWMGNELGQ